MFRKLLNKAVSVYVFLRHGKIDKNYRYFYRETYICKLVQVKYFFKDYVLKKPYKDIFFEGEFGAELLFVLPFAYWHYLNGTLRSTHSSENTTELFFFSKNHQQDFKKRQPEGNYNYEIPRILYSHDYNIGKWAPVPLKAIYKNDLYVFEKPILIIANKYNREWDGPPINFFNIPLLDFMFKNLKRDYQIIYNRPKPENIINDNSEVMDLQEHEWITRAHPEVILMEDLYKENKGEANNFNHLQLMVYANADHFISTHGGTATLASYFGGVNLIFSKKGGEHFFNCFNLLFPKLSSSKILLAKSDDEVKGFLRRYFIPQ